MADIFDWETAGDFDFVVCNGLVNLKLEASLQDIKQMSRRLLRRMFELSRVGCALNFMTSNVNFFAPHLYYQNPVEILAWSMTELTTKVRLDHAYSLYELPSTSTGRRHPEWFLERTAKKAPAAKMTVVISQSMYFPWPGLLEQVREADVFVHYDDVQYARGFLSRVQIKTAEGVRWMTLPLSGLKREQRIDEVQLDGGQNWQAQHREMLRRSYGRAPYREEMLALFDQVVSLPGDGLASIARRSLLALAEYFGFAETCRFVSSSELGVGGSGSARILGIVKALGGTTYVSGAGGRNYLDHQEFERQGIELRYMNYQITPYPQLHGAFSPYVSGLDLVAVSGRNGVNQLNSTTLPFTQPLS